MPQDSHPRPNNPRISPSSDPLTYEPALTQLRRLSPDRLDQLLRAWLSRAGFAQIRRTVPSEPALTYHALAESRLAAFALRVRLHQRRSRLQVHHVEAFAGHLLRTGVSAGLLITTGDFTPEARRVANSYRNLQIRLYSGIEWTAELAERRLGVRRLSLWHWVLDLAQGLRRSLNDLSQEER